MASVARNNLGAALYIEQVVSISYRESAIKITLLVQRA